MHASVDFHTFPYIFMHFWCLLFVNTANVLAPVMEWEILNLDKAFFCLS